MLLAKAIYLYKKVWNYSDVHALNSGRTHKHRFPRTCFRYKKNDLKYFPSNDLFTRLTIIYIKLHVLHKVYRKIRSISVDLASNVEDDNNQSVTIFVQNVIQLLTLLVTAADGHQEDAASVLWDENPSNSNIKFITF